MSESQASVLIDRIAGHDAGAADFRAFEVLAKDSPRTWEQLARALRDELHMRAALAAKDHAARAEAEIAVAVDASPRRNETQRFSIRTWSGWAVAAMIIFAWSLFMLTAEPSSTHAPDTGEIGTRLVSFTADDAYARYLEIGHSEGRIISELPARMVEMETAEDGGMVVYYIRQLLERERVNEMYKYAEDEFGRPMPVPVDMTSLSMTGSSL